MRRGVLWLAAVVGFTGVLAGAFGAHGLASRGVSAEAIGWWETGAKYHLVHAPVLLGVALLGRSGWITAAAWCFGLGVLVFAGTLYVMTLTDARWLGAVTPIGGLLLMIGWALLGVAAWRSPTPREPDRPTTRP
ncbi:MAG: DUF423 domain-containing protein [Planctomycetota bacterium]